ncbi:MAG TPA: hypothetical protein VM600_01725, partial [Actinomycetota bacterium]|nr:hypothetical protein [Actinomycetota bacterium]
MGLPLLLFFSRFRRTTQMFEEDIEVVAEDARTELRRQMNALAERLDRARWQVEATRVSLEGRPIPPYEEERSVACFFDPSHGAGVEEANIVEVSDGTVRVHIRRACAARLRNGEVPEPATVMVGGHDVPLAAAPRAYEGLGMGIAG